MPNVALCTQQVGLCMDVFIVNMWCVRIGIINLKECCFLSVTGCCVKFIRALTQIWFLFHGQKAWQKTPTSNEAETFSQGTAVPHTFLLEPRLFHSPTCTAWGSALRWNSLSWASYKNMLSDIISASTLEDLIEWVVLHISVTIRTKQLSVQSKVMMMMMMTRGWWWWWWWWWCQI